MNEGDSNMKQKVTEFMRGEFENSVLLVDILLEEDLERRLLLREVLDALLFSGREVESQSSTVFERALQISTLLRIQSATEHLLVLLQCAVDTRVHSKDNELKGLYATGQEIELF